jgi:hypothetical protein
MAISKKTAAAVSSNACWFMAASTFLFTPAASPTTSPPKAAKKVSQPQLANAVIGTGSPVHPESSAIAFKREIVSVAP